MVSVMLRYSSERCNVAIYFSSFITDPIHKFLSEVYLEPSQTSKIYLYVGFLTGFSICLFIEHKKLRLQKWDLRASTLSILCKKTSND